jgi:uncharacterized protein YcbK (DUF882 family)
MRFSKARLLQILKITTVVFIIFSLFFAINRRARNRVFPYFSTRCIDYKQKDYHRKLNDRIVDYSAEARRKGIKVCKTDKDLKSRISEGKLVRVSAGSRYLIDRLTFSNPYLTRDGKELLDEIARRFRDKASKKGIKGAKFIITSMTRKTENMKSLRRNNSNSSENSPHLYGNAFDITYKRFEARKWMLTNCDKKFLKDALGEVIFELRAERKCFATYERMQNCYHVVAR